MIADAMPNVSAAVCPTPENDRLGSALFACVVLALIPVVVAARIVPSLRDGRSYPLIVGVMSCLQAIVVLLHAASSRISVRRGLVLLALCLVAVPYITLALSVFRGGTVDVYDWLYPINRILGMAIFVLLPSAYCISRRGLQVFMGSIVLLGVIACVFNLAVNYRQMSALLAITNSYDASFRSFYLGRNSFAQLLMVAIAANTILLSTRSHVHSALLHASNALLAANLLLTFSRSHIVGAIVFGLVLVSAELRKRPMSLVGLIAVFILVIGLTAFASPGLREFVLRVVVRPQAGLASRQSIWRVAVAVLRDSSLLFGAGYGTSTQVLARMGFPDEFHSFWLSTLAAGGIVDLLLNSMVFLLVRSNLRSMRAADPKAGSVYAAAYAALAAISFVEDIPILNTTYAGTLLTVFFITIPLLYANSNRRGSASDAGVRDGNPKCRSANWVHQGLSRC